MKRNGWQCEALEKSIVADDPATPNRVQRMLFVPNDVPALSDKKIVNKFSEFMTDTYGKVNLAINKLISKSDGDEKIALYPASHLIFSALNESKLAEANISILVPTSSNATCTRARGPLPSKFKIIPSP